MNTRASAMGRAVAAVALGLLAVGCNGGILLEAGRDAVGPGLDSVPATADAGSGGDATSPSAPGAAGPSCANGRRDGDETDVDCGGAICPSCPRGDKCARASDCVTFECSAGICKSDVGCADGTREAFGSVAAHSDIAACAGGWSVPGLVDTLAPACGRAAGNSSAAPAGKGCSVADLCQVGWHVCTTALEVQSKSGGAGCSGAAFSGAESVFFLTRQSGPGGAACGAGTNDLFGCGTVGATPDSATCGVLDRFSHDLCSALPASWSCGSGNTSEAAAVRKTAPEHGGVLCCRD